MGREITSHRAALLAWLRCQQVSLFNRRHQKIQSAIRVPSECHHCRGISRVEIVELRTPAMPFGLGAFVGIKLRSLCWQLRFEQGWYCREAEGTEQVERVIKSPEKGRVLRVARKRADRKHACVHCQR